MLIINFLYLLTSFLISVFLAIIIIPRILTFAVKHSLYDNKKESRKKHSGLIPRLGGLSFTPCVLFSVMFVLGIYNIHTKDSDIYNFYPDGYNFYLFGAGLVLLFVGGVKDDLVGLRYRHKFLIQILSSILIIISGLYINNLYGFLGIYELSAWIGMPLTILFFVFVINALNLIDGIDGLASGISIFALCVYGTLFFLHGLWLYSFLAFSTVGVLIPFFYYNVFGNADRGRKLFMGDSGSLSLGFILSYLAVRYVYCDMSQVRPTQGILVISMSPILLPMLDVLRVILFRIRTHKNIFEADRNHIHHKLLNMGFNQSITLVILLFMSCGLCIMNFLLIPIIGSTYIFLIDITLWSSINIYFSHVIKKRQLKALSKKEKEDLNYESTRISVA